MKRFSSNITDEELYRVFRNAARHYDPKLNDSERKGVWESIANNLLSATAGDNISITNKWKRRCIALILLWLLTGGLAIFRIIQLQEIKGRSGTDNTIDPVALKERGQADIKPRPLENGAQKKNTTTIKPDIKKNTTPYNCLNNNYTVVMNRPGKPGDTTDRSVESIEQSVGAANRSNQPIETTNQFTESTDPFIKSTNPLKALSHSPGIPDSSTTTPPKQPLPKKRQRPRQGWSIGLATGTEWSKVPGDPLGGTGILYGFTVQYRFAPRWSVETGIVVTPKLYSKRSGSYDDQMAGTLFNEPNIIDANCRIIDIQMNIRYDVMHKRDGRLFTGAGLSSFRMQKEEYIYRFEIIGSWIEDHYRFFNENDHLFAAANIMAGYEYTRKRFSLQAAPYMKIPLKQIGHGKINLFSSGLQLSVKYSIR